MDIKFSNSKVEKLITDYKKVNKQVGQEMTREIKKQIDRLRSMPDFQQFIKLGLGKPHLLTGDLSGCYGIHINAHSRLIVSPISDDLSPEALSNCTAVTVKGVDEYHDGKNEWIIP